jgi:type IV secretory pathway VirB2 component (pilin)
MIKKIILFSILVSTFIVSNYMSMPVYSESDAKIKDGRIESIPTPGNISKLDENNVLKNILNAVYSISGLIAVLIIVICGVMIITADGDSQKVATARTGIIYALIGLVIIISAFIITGVVLNTAGSKL